MTENKIKEKLNDLHSKILRSSFAKNVTESEIMALIENEKALEEVQQYRAIGTMEELQEAKIQYDNINSAANSVALSGLCDFSTAKESIVSTFKALKENQRNCKDCTKSQSRLRQVERMSRLIDADALIEDVRKRPYIDKALSEIFEIIIDEQPTAYDVEKVVAELEEATYRIDDSATLSTRDVINDDEAIDIVRKGGVDE